jgi:hypothetical protein
MLVRRILTRMSLKDSQPHRKNRFHLSVSPRAVVVEEFVAHATAVFPEKKRDWRSFTFEIVALCVISIYAVVFVIGRGINTTIAQEWFISIAAVLQNNFASLGVDGSKKIIRENAFQLLLLPHF